MRLLLLLAFFSASVALASSGRVVCYFISWSIYRSGDGKFQASDVDPTLCDYLIYSYVGLWENGTIKLLDDWEFTSLMELDHLKTLKTLNPDLKILASVGGWTVGSEEYSPVAADPTLRANLVSSIVDFLDTYGFDGVDLDWEYPAQNNGSDPTNDPANYVTLLNELKTGLGGNYVFSAGVSGIVWYTYTAYPDGKAISDAVDFLNVKSLDYHGDWETVTGHYAPLDPLPTDADQTQNVRAGIQRWITLGADPAKLNLGIGSYGRPFTLIDPDEHGLGAPVNGTGALGPLTAESGMWGYNEICALFDDYTYVWDDTQSVPYKYSGDQWVGYDDPDSVKAKVALANELGLGGVSLWSLDTDDFLGNCGETFGLLKTIIANLD